MWVGPMQSESSRAVRQGCQHVLGFPQTKPLVGVRERESKDVRTLLRPTQEGVNDRNVIITVSNVRGEMSGWMEDG